MRLYVTNIETINNNFQCLIWACGRGNYLREPGQDKRKLDCKSRGRLIQASRKVVKDYPHSQFVDTVYEQQGGMGDES